MVREENPLRLQEGRLPADEFGEAALDGIAIDIAPPGRGQDRDVRPKIAHQTRPMTRRVLIEHRSFGRLDQIDECAAVAAFSLPALEGVRPRFGRERRDERFEMAEAFLLLIEREAHVAETHDVGLLERARPDAGVQARIHRNDDVVAQTDALAAGDRQQL